VCLFDHHAIRIAATGSWAHYGLGPAAPLDVRTIALRSLTYGGSQQQLDPSHFLCSRLLTHIRDIFTTSSSFPPAIPTPGSHRRNLPPTIHCRELTLLLLHGVGGRHCSNSLIRIECTRWGIWATCFDNRSRGQPHIARHKWRFLTNNNHSYQLSIGSIIGSLASDQRPRYKIFFYFYSITSWRSTAHCYRKWGTWHTTFYSLSNILLFLRSLNR